MTLTRYLRLRRVRYMRGADVKAAQLIVEDTRPDGVFGPDTRRAVMNHQRRRGLVVDGIVGPQTARDFGWRVR